MEWRIIGTRERPDKAVRREEIYRDLFSFLSPLGGCGEFVNGFCKYMVINLLKLQGLIIRWWRNVSFIVNVLERLCMGPPMNRRCAHSMKSRV